MQLIEDFEFRGYALRFPLIARNQQSGTEVGATDAAPSIDARAQLKRKDGGVCWAHPAFANRHVFARNDEELVCASLAADNR